MAVVSLKPRSPQAHEVGLNIPANVDKELFKQGFSHGMRSNILTVFKASYRAGFREAKLQLRELRRRQGVLAFPMRAKLSAG